MQFILQMQLWNNWNHKAAQLYQIIVRSGFSGQSLATSESMDGLVYRNGTKSLAHLKVHKYFARDISIVGVGVPSC